MKTRLKALISAVILCFAVIFSVNSRTTLNVYAESHLFSLNGGYAEENSIVNVTASIDPAIVMAAFSVTLYFDPSMLEFVDASFTEDYGTFYFGDSYEDSVSLVWSDSRDRTFENELITMRFKTKSGTSGCTIPIEVGYAICGNSANDEIYVDTKGCEVIVTRDYKWGDANCDGRVSVSDAVKITLFSIDYKKYPLTEIQLTNSDTDKNGIVNIKDANIIIDHIIKP